MACFGIDLQTAHLARRILDDVFAHVAPDSMYERPIPARHRIVFYLGHVEAFDWNLCRNALGESSATADLDQLFAFGIDPPPGQLPSDAPGDWPEMRAVRDYCSRIREALDQRWNCLPAQLRHVAIEHRLMHAETLSYMLHNLPHERLIRPVEQESGETFGEIHQEKLEVPAGTAVLGRCPADGFGWDNEFSRTDVQVDRFLVDRYKVTNGQYQEFVNAGATAPLYWAKRNGKWYLRRMFDQIPLPLDWPVWVTQEEAASFAEWKGAALPTEAQWHRAAYSTAEGDTNEYPWTGSVNGHERGNFDANRWDPQPVAAHPEAAAAFGIEDLAGNGWEWTSSLLRPFDGFRAFPFYPGYSANFFDNDHYVMKGASPRTDAVFLRRSFRNWFRKDYPYVFAGFRCVYKAS